MDLTPHTWDTTDYDALIAAAPDNGVADGLSDNQKAELLALLGQLEDAVACEVVEPCPASYILFQACGRSQYYNHEGGMYLAQTYSLTPKTAWGGIPAGQWTP